MSTDFKDMTGDPASGSPLHPQVQGFFDPYTFSVQNVVSDPVINLCAIIDPVLDCDEKSGSTATRSADAILNHVSARGLSLAWILGTHAHADHFSTAVYLKDVTGTPTGIGEHVERTSRRHN
jgi:glyoxylase-like metal-dependent hydrolase (beta-lactamase superfamily II)